MLASGTAASHAIAMAFSPVITRLYGPEAYGLQGVFFNVVALLAVVAALGYPIAIVLPEEDSSAVALIKLCLGGATAVAAAIGLVLWTAGDSFLRLLNAAAIAPFKYLIPAAAFSAVIVNVISHWLIRKKSFNISARYAVMTTLMTSAVKTAGGFLHPSALVLITTNAAGSLIGALLTWAQWRRDNPTQPKPVEEAIAPSLWELARTYKDFPLLRTPTTLINALAQSLPLILLAAYFGPAAAGQYSLGMTILGVPGELIGSSVTAVFYPRINDAVRNAEDARSLILRATKAMFLMGALPCVLIVAAGPLLFEFVFGSGWHRAGLYAQWLAPWLLLKYISKPASSSIPALGLQKEQLAFEMCSTATKVFGLWLGFSVFKSDVAAVAFFSAFGVAGYLWLIAWILRKSRSARN
jgi:O-antigen/teichoic acid export membrane protein